MEARPWLGRWKVPTSRIARATPSVRALGLGSAPATHERCLAMLAFHIDRGDIEGIDVSGLTFALVVDTPPIMADGGWKLGVVMDSAATDQQAGALGRVLGGQLGGPPAMLGPLIGEMAGIEQVPPNGTSPTARSGSVSVN